MYRKLNSTIRLSMASIIILPLIGNLSGCCCAKPSVTKPASGLHGLSAPYKVLRRGDYIKITGCKQVFGYNHSLQAAINYLVFARDHVPGDDLIKFKSLGYARRHSAPLFQSISQNGVIDKKCLHPTIKRIGLELKLINHEGRMLPGVKTLSRTTYQYPDLDKSLAVFEIMPRAHYIKSTGCLVSPASYHKLHKAFFYAIIDSRGFDDIARNSMKSFLHDVGEGRRTRNNTVDPMCMNTSVRTLAQYFNLLNKKGQFELKSK